MPGEWILWFFIGLVLNLIIQQVTLRWLDRRRIRALEEERRSRGA